MLGLIAQLYQVEKQIRDESLDTESILELRAKKSARTRKWIGVVLRILAARHTPSHELVRASNYALKIWDELGTYLKHAHVAIDNNAMDIVREHVDGEALLCRERNAGALWAA